MRERAVPEQRGVRRRGRVLCLPLRRWLQRRELCGCTIACGVVDAVCCLGSQQEICTAAQELFLLLVFFIPQKMLKIQFCRFQR